MATKLRNMKLTSVDLVRAGANQEADICLFKSADPPEATESPTEPEKNIFKRFITWLRENPTEAATEPHSPIEKADEPADLVTIYKSALTESIRSIYADPTLTETEKATMVEKSVEQFTERILKEDLSEEETEKNLPSELGTEEHTVALFASAEPEIEEIEEVDVSKYNHNHGADGKFTTSGGGGGGWHVAPSGGGTGRKVIGRNAMLDEPKEPKEEITYKPQPKKPDKNDKWNQMGNPYAGQKFTSPEIEQAMDRKYRGIGALASKVDSTDFKGIGRKRQTLDVPGVGSGEINFSLKAGGGTIAHAFATDSKRKIIVNDWFDSGDEARSRIKQALKDSIESN